MIVWALLAGCTSECAGPGCADAWPTSRLIVIDDGELDSQTNILTLSDRVQGTMADGADWSVAARTGTLFVGMPERSAVRVLDRPKGTELTDLLEVDLATQARSERFGASVALADTDGDGVTELWVGAPGFEGGAGAVYRYPDADDLAEGWDLRLTSVTAADGLGSQIFRCGDVTGDAADDLVLVAPRFVEPQDATWASVPGGIPSLAGAVWLIPSDTLQSRPDATHPWELGPTWWGANRGDGAGTSVVCDRDLTGDGQADVAIGVPYAGVDEAGRVFVFSAADGLPAGGALIDTLPRTLLPDTLTQGWFGAALATRVDADGTELVVGASGYEGGRGRVALFRSPLPEIAGNAPFDALFTNPRGEPDHFGHALATGDYDGDGWSDLFVGAPGWREQRGTGEARTRYDTGRGWIWTSPNRFRWTPDDADLDANHVIRGNQPFLQIGQGAVFVDVDGDGIDELLQPVRAPAR